MLSRFRLLIVCLSLLMCLIATISAEALCVRCGCQRAFNGCLGYAGPQPDPVGCGGQVDCCRANRRSCHGSGIRFATALTNIPTPGSCLDDGWADYLSTEQVEILHLVSTISSGWATSAGDQLSVAALGLLDAVANRDVSELVSSAAIFNTIDEQLTAEQLGELTLTILATLNPPDIFSDGFELGDLSAWSSTELLINGGFEVFTNGLPVSWDYQGDDPATLQSPLQSPFTTTYPLGNNSVVLSPGSDSPPLLSQDVPEQTGLVAFSFDFFLDAVTGDP
ncbi:hypothetical protein AC249_AIPGENE23976, partial [Exaiptasia diaphana]